MLGALSIDGRYRLCEIRATSRDHGRNCRIRATARPNCFRKGVPQVQDLLASWTACKSNQSWVNAATNVRLFQYGSFTRGGEQQIWIRLSEAKVVSLALDDRGNYTLIRFACDIGLAPPQASTELGSHHGILGVLDTSLGLTEEDFNEDYAKRVVEQLSMAIQLCFTDLEHDGADESQVQSFCSKVRLVAADKALSKSVEFMKRYLFPNLITYQRDPSHAIRIAVGDPLERAERFEDIFKMLFKDQHALLKDLRFSDLWKAKITEWQRRIIQDRGFLGGEVTNIIREFTFAPQRFESFCTPFFNLLIIIPAIVKMLKMIAEDKRDPKQAQRASKAMRQIDGQWILDIGLIADFGSISLKLLRKFDRHSRDPAVTRKHIRQWESTMESLSCEGNVFRAAPSTAAGKMGSNHLATAIPKSAAQIAMEQIGYTREVDYTGRVQDFLAVLPKDLFARGCLLYTSPSPRDRQKSRMPSSA